MIRHLCSPSISLLNLHMPLLFKFRYWNADALRSLCSIYLLDWILTTGYATVISGAFVAVLLANNLMVPVFMWKGKSIRRFMASSWLGRLHARTRVAEEVA